MDEAKLIDKLRRIEALFKGATTQGERAAAASARERVVERLREVEDLAPPVEYKFSMADMWSRQLFVALLRRYNYEPYRYSGQKHTTVLARVSKRFVDETLWPQFLKLDNELRTYLGEITSRVVAQAIHNDVSEATERVETKFISGGC
jgi:hypothetical protein